MTTPNGGELLRRDDVVSGSFQSQRRATRVLGTIEARVLHMRDETRRAIDAYFFDKQADYRRKVDRGYLASVLARTRAEDEVSLNDFERFAAQWRSLVPADPRVRADVLHRLVVRFGPALGGASSTLEAFGANSEQVLDAYQQAFDELPNLEPERASDATRAGSGTVESATWLRVNRGQRIFAQGESAEALYLVVNGRLQLTTTRGGSRNVEWEYGRGDAVGEAEVLTGEDHPGDLVAQRDSELVCVPQERVLALARERPEVLLRLNRTLAKRLRGMNSADGASRRAHTFALLPGTPGAPLPEIARALTERLGVFGSVSHIDRRALDDHLPEGRGFDEEAYEAEVIAWLSEQETQFEYLVAEGEGDAGSEWSERCRRQSDRVILVADAGTPPDVDLIERATSNLDAPPDLLLVHPSDAERPKGTRAWLKAANPRFVYHWRLGDEAQAAHIARRLTGNGVALVLSSGAARGYAHIGAMQALAERGIPIDVIAGSSMGALVGAGFSLGRDPSKMRTSAIAMASRRKLLDPTLPLTAFTSGAKVTRMLRREAEGERIEDLWRPYFCVSANLTRATAEVHSEGPLWHAIRASIAIPGIFPPVLAKNGDLLVDGSSINNMPIDLARNRDDVSTVIAVTVSSARDHTESYRFGPAVSGWTTLLRRLRKAPIAGAPGLFSTVMRANEVRGAALMRSPSFTALADLIIQPPVEQFSLLQFSQCRSIIDCGYDAAKAALDSWLEREGKALTTLGIEKRTK